MVHPLIRHPESACASVTSINAEVACSATTVKLRYLLSGDVSAIRLPVRVAATRADNLWQHTCCEAFVATGNDTEYFEFNFSPSTEWAAYRFASYRAGMSAIDDVHVHVNTRIERERFELVAEVGCPVLRTSTHCQIGLSCVIEEMSGNKSYWALMHSPGKPDFHHHSTFTASLPAL